MGDSWAVTKECCLCGKTDSFLGKLLGPVGKKPRPRAGEERALRYREEDQMKGRVLRPFPLPHCLRGR